MALASHVKTMFTDPGGVPATAVPRIMGPNLTTHIMCAHCQCYKPDYSHHCRICRRCISRMDHHCPWMNNCVGSGNMSKCIWTLYIWIHAKDYVFEKIHSVHPVQSVLTIPTHKHTYNQQTYQHEPLSHTHTFSLFLPRQNISSCFYATLGPVVPLLYSSLHTTTSFVPTTPASLGQS